MVSYEVLAEKWEEDSNNEVWANDGTYCQWLEDNPLVVAETLLDGSCYWRAYLIRGIVTNNPSALLEYVCKSAIYDDMDLDEFCVNLHNAYVIGSVDVNVNLEEGEFDIGICDVTTAPSDEVFGVDDIADKIAEPLAEKYGVDYTDEFAEMIKWLLNNGKASYIDDDIASAYEACRSGVPFYDVFI